MLPIVLAMYLVVDRIKERIATRKLAKKQMVVGTITKMLLG
jgi:hypothetical protein